MLSMFLNKVRANIIVVDALSVGFLCGYVLGYSHFFDNKTFDLLSLFFKNIHLLKEWFLRFHPSPDFLSDIAAFEAAVIAFLIPLSIEIISKVSERYESEITTEVFEKRPSNRLLPYLLMFNILLAVVLRFFVNTQNGSSHLVMIASWVTLIFFIIIAFMILQVIRNIKKFMTNKKFIIQELINDAKKSIE